jgi:hypothetical protein
MGVDRRSFMRRRLCLVIYSQLVSDRLVETNLARFSIDDEVTSASIRKDASIADS